MRQKEETYTAFIVCWALFLAGLSVFPAAAEAVCCFVVPAIGCEKLLGAVCQPVWARVLVRKYGPRPGKLVWQR